MSSGRIIITFYGDFVASHPNEIEFSNDIDSLISSSDVNVVNFEAPIETNEKALMKSGPSLFQSKDSPCFLENKGFNVVSMANNHIFDYNLAGCEQSVSSFKKASVIGVGNWDEAYKVRIKVINNIRVGFIALCHREFMVLDDSSDTTQKYGCAWVNHHLALDRVREARRDCDYLFVYPHAGVEDIDVPIPEWRNVYRQFIDAGADAVVASHPHIIQGCECYKGRFIYYSLGNFFFERENMPSHWKKGLCVSFTIQDGTISPSLFFVRKDGMKLTHDVDELANFNKLNALLGNSPEYEKRLNDYVRKLMPMYLYYYKLSLNGLPNDKRDLKMILRCIKSWLRGKHSYLLLLNMIRCESHRWLFMRGLNLMIYNNCK